MEKKYKKIGKFKNCRKILIVPDKNALEKEPEDIEVCDAKKVLEILKNLKNI